MASKNLKLFRLNDLLLGAFSRAHPSETLDHLLRYLSTWSGSDKLFMLVQYIIKLLVPFLNFRARMQHRVGIRKNTTSSAAASLSKLASVIGDARRLWGIWGALSIVQWLISLERSPPPTRNLLTIERLQGWSMLAFYPLEHISYFLSHSIVPASIPSVRSLLPFSGAAKRTVLDEAKLGLWSCRLWGLYVVLQFAHLREDLKLLKAKERTLSKAKGKGPPIEIEKAELLRRRDAFWNEVVVNLGYLPMTIHWSLEKGLFGNDVWVNLCGFIAAVASFRGGWKATALPAAPTASAAPAAVNEKDASPLGSPLDLSSSQQFGDALAVPPLTAYDASPST